MVTINKSWEKKLTERRTERRCGSSTAIFSNLGAANILGQMIICCGEMSCVLHKV